MAHKNRPEVSAPTDDGNEISTDQHSRLHFSKLILSNSVDSADTRMTLCHASWGLQLSHLSLAATSMIR